MNKIKNEFLVKWVLATPVMHACNVNVVDEKSRKVQNVNTNMQDEYISLLKSRAQLAQMEDDDDNVFAKSLIDRYAARPN